MNYYQDGGKLNWIGIVFYSANSVCRLVDFQYMNPWFKPVKAKVKLASCTSHPAVISIRS